MFRFALPYYGRFAAMRAGFDRATRHTATDYLGEIVSDSVREMARTSSGLSVARTTTIGLKEYLAAHDVQ